MACHPLPFPADVEYHPPLLPVGAEFAEREAWYRLEPALRHTPGLEQVGARVSGYPVEPDPRKILNQLVHHLPSVLVHDKVELTIVGKKGPGPCGECPA